MEKHLITSYLFCLISPLHYWYSTNNSHRDKDLTVWLGFLTIAILSTSAMHCNNKNMNEPHLKKKKLERNLGVHACATAGNQTGNMSSRIEVIVVWFWASLPRKPDLCNIGKGNRKQAVDINVLPPWTFPVVRTKQNKKTAQKERKILCVPTDKQNKPILKKWQRPMTKYDHSKNHKASKPSKFKAFVFLIKFLIFPS